MAGDGIDAQTVIRDFRQDLDDYTDLWYSFGIHPYIEAYRSAHQRFRDTLKRQEKLDQWWQQKKLELIVAALSLGGGGLLVAVTGKAALKTVAKDVAINQICNRNLDRLFRAAHWIEGNEVATFLVGQAWDDVGMFLGNAVKESLKPEKSHLPALTDLGNAQDPDAVKDAMKQFVRLSKIRIADVARSMLYRSTASDEQKLNTISKLRRAPFCRPPRRLPQDEKRSKRIELAFFMTLLLDTDKLVTWGGSSYWGGQPSRRGSSSIDVSPTSRNYPAAGSKYTGTSVEYDRIGQVVAERIDEVHRECGFGGPFFRSRTEALFGEHRPDRRLLTRAEQTLQELGRLGTGTPEELQSLGAR